MKKPLLVNHPDINSIKWDICDKDKYEEFENLLTDGVKMFDPFQVNDFFSEEDFKELKNVCMSNSLKSLDYNQHLNKWEQQIQIPQHLIDKALDKVKKLIGVEDIHMGYYYYTHHQISEDGRSPKLPLHIDYSQGPYMLGIVISKNMDWEIIAQDKVFYLEENQAYISQPQHDYHWRPKWNITDPDRYHSILLFHFINRNNWSVPNDSPLQQRSERINNKFPDFGPNFVFNEDYDLYRRQQRVIFDPIYINDHANSNLPPIPWEERPTPEDIAKEKRIKNIGSGA